MILTSRVSSFECWIEVQVWLCCTIYLKPVDGVSDPGRSLSSSLPDQARDCGSELLKAVVTADRGRRVKSFEVSSRWQFPLYQWYGMGVCYIPSLALTLQLLFTSIATWYPVPESGNAHTYTYRVNEIFAWFNFHWCAWATKIKQCEKLTGEI